VAGDDDNNKQYATMYNHRSSGQLLLVAMWHVHNMMMAHSWSSVELWKQQLTTLPFSAVRPRGVSQQHAATTSQEAGSA
jgi:hypothetical protein